MSRVLLHLLLLGSFSIALGQEIPADSPEQDAKALTAEFRKQARRGWRPESFEAFRLGLGVRW
jgi:hypothetical protein